MNRRKLALMLVAATLALLIAACVPAPTSHWGTSRVYSPAIHYGPATGGAR